MALIAAYRYAVTTRTVKMGSDESHFNVSAGSGGESHKIVSANHKLFEEKGEPKWYRTDVTCNISPKSVCHGSPKQSFGAFLPSEVCEQNNVQKV